MPVHKLKPSDRPKEQPRCPFCHAAIAGHEITWICASCGTTHHDACFRENGHCTVHGCASGAGVTRGVSECVLAARRRRRKRIVVSGLALISTLGAGFVLARNDPHEERDRLKFQQHVRLPEVSSRDVSPLTAEERNLPVPRVIETWSPSRSCDVVLGPSGQIVVRRDDWVSEFGPRDGRIQWVGSERWGKALLGTNECWSLVLSGTRFSEEDRDIVIYQRLASRLVRRHGWTHCAVAPFNGRAVVASTRNRLEVWDLEGEPTLRRELAPEFGISALAISHDGKRALTGSLDGAVQYWDLERGKEWGPALRVSGEVLGVVLSEPGLHAVIASGDGESTTIRWISVEPLEEIQRIVVPGAARKVALSAGLPLAVVSGIDLSLRLAEFAVDGWPVKVRVLDPCRWVDAIAISPDGRTAVTVANDEPVLQWDLDRIAAREDARSTAVRSRARTAQQDIGTALDVLDTLESESELTWETRLERGQDRIRMHDFKGAVNDAKSVIESAADRQTLARAHVIRGQARLCAGSKGALDDLDEGIRLGRGELMTIFGEGQPYCFRATARASSGDLQGAIADLDEALRRGGRRSAWTLLQRGVTNAVLGERKSALDDIHEAEQHPGDERFWSYERIWYALLSGDSSWLSSVDQSRDWPGSVARFLGGKITADQFLTDANRGAESHRVCEAYGFMGALAEARGDLTTARTSYESCVATHHAGDWEYWWARGRLQRLSDATKSPFTR